MHTPPHIIVAEPEPQLRFLLRRLIRSACPQAEIEEVGDGSEALARYEQGGAALLITSDVMPQMDGHALRRALRSRSASLPIILLTIVPGRPQHPGDGATLVLDKLDALSQLPAAVTSLLPALARAAAA